MHNLGWQSVYCITKRDVLRATGFVEIFFNRNNPLLATHRLKFLQRVAYFNVGVYPFTPIFLVVLLLPSRLIPLLWTVHGKSLNIAFLSYLLTITVTLCPISLLEVKWSGIALEEWWRNEQFWVIGGSSAHLVAVIQGLLKVIAGIEISIKLTTKLTAEDEDDIYADLYVVKWTSLFLMTLTIIVVNLIVLIMASARTIYSVIPEWSKLFGGAFFSFWVLAHMYPFAKGLMGRKGKMPTIICVWAGLVSITVSLLWISISPPSDNSTVSSSGLSGNEKSCGLFSNKMKICFHMYSEKRHERSESSVAVVT